MATKTINALTVATTAAVGDFVPIWRIATGDTRKITKANLIGATISGGGTLALGGNSLTVAADSTISGSLVGNMTGGGTLATGGFTLTVPATGNAALKTGTPVAGRVASWTDGNFVQDGGFALTDVARLSLGPTFGSLVTSSVGYRSGTVNINNNAFFQFTPGLVGGLILVMCNNSVLVYGIANYRQSSYIQSVIAGTNLTITNVVLNGTTGTAGKATISLSGTDFYIENQLGSARAFSWLIIG